MKFALFQITAATTTQLQIRRKTIFDCCKCVVIVLKSARDTLSA